MIIFINKREYINVRKKQKIDLTVQRKWFFACLTSMERKAIISGLVGFNTVLTRIPDSFVIPIMDCLKFKWLHIPVMAMITFVGSTWLLPEYRAQKSLVFRCFRNSGVRYLGHYCIHFSVFVIMNGEACCNLKYAWALLCIYRNSMKNVQ